MSGHEAKSSENNETDCDNPISLDEIEKGMWLGMCVNWYNTLKNV